MQLAVINTDKISAGYRAQALDAAGRRVLAKLAQGAADDEGAGGAVDGSAPSGLRGAIVARNPAQDRLLTADDLRKLLRAGYDLLNLRRGVVQPGNADNLE